jgi:hypothetical protein
LPSLLGNELVNIRGNALVEIVLVIVKVECDGMRVPIGEEPLPVRISEVFLEATQTPWRILAEFENVLSYFSGLLP